MGGSSLEFLLVDAFTDVSCKGNPAAVCFLEEYPGQDLLQAIAKFHNWSEISFVKQLDDNEFQIRWFSPNDEVPLCGHATLAASFAIFQTNKTTSNDIIIHYNSGILKATNHNQLVTLNFPAKPTYPCNKDSKIIKKALNIDKIINIERDDLVYVVELQDPKTVKGLEPNLSLISQLDCRAVAVTAKGSDYDFHSRYFAPKVGINEDPVCGSMHCRLAYYWSQKLNKTQFKAFQDSKRTGQLDVRIVEDSVYLTGNAVIVARFKTRY